MKSGKEKKKKSEKKKKEKNKRKWNVSSLHTKQIDSSPDVVKAICVNKRFSLSKRDDNNKKY